MCLSVSLLIVNLWQYLYMLHKIRCNPMHTLYGALPVPYVPVRVTCSALVAHRYTYAPSRCRTSQYRGTFIHLTVSLWDPVFDGVGLTVSRSGPKLIYWPTLLYPFLSSAIFPFLFFLSIGWYCGACVDSVKDR